MRFRLLLIFVSLLGLTGSARAQFNYTTNNGTITINQYTGPGGAVFVPDEINGLKVTTIGTAAFYQIANLTSVTLGTNVTTIADNAFFQNPALASVSMPGAVTNIGQGPFIDCLALTTLTFSSTNSHYSITNGVLFNKTLTSLIQFPGGVGGSYTIPATVTNTGQAFIGNTLTAIAVHPENVIYSGTNGVLFSKNKSQLISYPGALSGPYSVPTNVTIIVSASFEYASGITSVAIGTNVNSIGLLAFYDCQNLTGITVDPASPFYSSLNGVLFDKNKTLLVQYPCAVAGFYVMPNTVTDVGDGAFGDAFNLTGVVMASGVTNIGQQAFYSCQNLASATLGSHLVTVGASAFFLCKSLSSLIFPPTVASIGSFAFGGCQNLSSVCFEGNQPLDGGSIFTFDHALSTILHVNGTTGSGNSV